MDRRDLVSSLQLMPAYLVGFYQQTTTWPLTPSCGWQHVWYLFVRIADHGSHSMIPNGLFNIWYPSPFFYFTHKASWVCWPWATLQPGMDLTHPFGRGETSSVFRWSGIVSAEPSHDGRLIKRRDTLDHCRALTLEEQKPVLPLCGLCLSNENEVVRQPSAIQS